MLCTRILRVSGSVSVDESSATSSYPDVVAFNMSLHSSTTRTTMHGGIYSFGCCSTLTIITINAIQLPIILLFLLIYKCICSQKMDFMNSPHSVPHLLLLSPSELFSQPLQYVTYYNPSSSTQSDCH